MLNQDKIRNIAIIAHVDHGKTTLIDSILRQSGTFREGEVLEDRVMDSNDIERERGITILSKNTSLHYDGYKINLIDTPGHADFGGEVERGLSLVNGVVLLVDAVEGCMPQTRFVLKKALAANLVPIIAVNKADREGARPIEVVDEVLELFMDLGATDAQLDSPVIYVSGRDGWSNFAFEEQKGNMKPLLDLIVNSIPSPEGDREAPFRMLNSNIDFDAFTGRIAIGKIERGTVKVGDSVAVCHEDGTSTKTKISTLYIFEGLSRLKVEEAGAGEIVAISGLGGIEIGETVCDANNIEPLPFTKIDEPVLSMNFMVNNSPKAGMDGKFVTSRQIRDRLFRELEMNVALRVEETDSADTYKVSGRGELHLSVLIENMRREGFEFMVGKPNVITKEIDGVLCEPYETLVVDVPEDCAGSVIEKIAKRKGEMTNMHPAPGNFTRLEFEVPSRGLIGYRSELMTDTKGNGIMSSLFLGYRKFSGEINSRQRGSLVCWEDGESITYGLYNAQERGTLFIGAGVRVYEGMVVGENARGDDITVNVCKKKQLTNTRASGSDDSLRLTPPKLMSLEQCIDFIADDEYVEVTPINLRIRKRILKNDLRMKDASKKKK